MKFAVGDYVQYYCRFDKPGEFSPVGLVTFRQAGNWNMYKVEWARPVPGFYTKRPHQSFVAEYNLRPADALQALAELG